MTSGQHPGTRIHNSIQSRAGAVSKRTANTHKYTHTYIHSQIYTDTYIDSQTHTHIYTFTYTYIYKDT